jgi:two-component system OmpR family sensor kinase
MSNQPISRPTVPLRGQEGSLVVVGIGVCLALLGGWHVFRSGGFGSGLEGGSVLFINVGLPLVAVGFMLYATQEAMTRDWTVVRWMFASIFALVTLGAWTSAEQLLAGEFMEARGTLVLGANLGILFGVVTGVNRARAKQNAELAERERAQREGMAFVNHLLRHHVLNGMTIINGYTDELRDEAVSDEHIEVIERQSDRIVTLVENVQTLVQSLSGESEPKPVDISDIADRSVADARETYPNASFELDVDSATVYADDFLRAVLDNLITNAVEHHDGEPNVHVTVEAGDPTILRVKDDGPGIPENIRQSFTDKDDMATGISGDGLGLYLVHTLVTSYEGSVSITDNQPRGTVVTVELPRA